VRNGSLKGQVWSGAIAIGIALAVTVLLLTIGSDRPGAALKAFFVTPLTNRYYVGNMLNSMAGLLLAGLGIVVAFRAGLYNLGGEGQIYVSALAGTVVGLALASAPGWIGSAAVIAAAIAAGALLAGLSGALRHYFGTPELITSFLLSAAVIPVVDHLITGPLNDPGRNLLATRTLPESFWEKSSLYPLPADASYKKNNHASAWHIDLDHDVRSLMSVEPNAEWWETVHHELGHIYYYLAYSRPEVPPLLRRGANRAFHESIGSLLGLASMQRPFLVGVGLIDSSAHVDPIQKMLAEAMNTVVFIPWSCGVMTNFEEQLYSKPLPENQYNTTWWAMKEHYQGIAPPEDRGEEFCDAASKTHINNDPAGYYDYALAYVLLMQLHQHIASDILHQDPHATNYYGNKEVGDFIWSILKQGNTGDWRQILREKTGGEFSAQPMLDYYAPLMQWLQEQNKGRTATLPEL